MIFAVVIFAVVIQPPEVHVNAKAGFIQSMPWLLAAEGNFFH